MKYSAQNSITIKRLRTGDSIYLTLELNGKPLYQAVDEKTGRVMPDWSIDSNRPIITPKASTTRSSKISLTYHSWTYNGIVLNFNGETSGNYILDSTGKFGLNSLTGALKIFSNLASSENYANDTLKYDGIAVVEGLEYKLSKTMDIQIQKLGASSYYGFIVADTMQLDSSVPKATLRTELWLAASPVSSYYVKWYKDNQIWTNKIGMSTIEVNREDIDGQQLFIAEFYLNSSDDNYVYRAGITVIDTLDEIILAPYISSSNKEVDSGMPVEVKARIIKTKDNSVITPTNPQWQFLIMDGVTWEQLDSSNTDSIQVTTAHTDKDDGSSNDVVVIAEVTYE